MLTIIEAEASWTLSQVAAANSPATCLGPPNSTCAISPSSVMLSGSATSKVTLLASKNVNHGTFTLTFTGTLGNLTHTINVSLTVK
jgi:hypothetical protein